MKITKIQSFLKGKEIVKSSFGLRRENREIYKLCDNICDSLEIVFEDDSKIRFDVVEGQIMVTNSEDIYE